MELVTEELVREKLVDVIDPELRMSIMELGLVYDVDIDEGSVKVTYTLTSPACPLGPVISGQIENLLLEIIEARAVRNPDGRVWDFLERLTEEVLLLRADRERELILKRPTELH